MEAKNAGKLWTPADEQYLVSSWLNKGMSVGEIADDLERTVGGITCRLSKLDMLGGLKDYDIDSEDTSRTVALRSYGNSATQDQANQTREKTTMKHEQINYAINLNFGGYFTKTDHGWYKTFDELPVGWLAVAASDESLGRLFLVQVEFQTKKCPHEIKNHTIDFLMSKDQKKDIKTLREQEAATAKTLLDLAVEAENEAEDNAVREVFGFEKMEFVRQMLKTSNPAGNLENIAKAYKNMGGDQQNYEALAALASVMEALDIISNSKGTGSIDRKVDNPEEGKNA